MFGKNKKGRVPSAKKDFTKLKTPHTYAIIFFVVIACWLLTFLILLAADISDPGGKIQHPRDRVSGRQRRDSYKDGPYGGYVPLQL